MCECLCVCVCVCVLLHSKANPLPTGESPGASYNGRKMSHGHEVIAYRNEWASVCIDIVTCSRALAPMFLRHRRCANVANMLTLNPTYLLDVIVQCDDFQGRGQVCAAWDGCTHRWGLTHVSLIGGKLEVRRLVVLIQDLDDEVSVGREGVSVILLSLRTGVLQGCCLAISCLETSQTLTEMWEKLFQLLQLLQWLISLCHWFQKINWFILIGGHLG